MTRRDVAVFLVGICFCGFLVQLLAYKTLDLNCIISYIIFCLMDNE